MRFDPRDEAMKNGLLIALLAAGVALAGYFALRPRGGPGPDLPQAEGFAPAAEVYLARENCGLRLERLEELRIEGDSAGALCLLRDPAGAEEYWIVSFVKDESGGWRACGRERKADGAEPK